MPHIIKRVLDIQTTNSTNERNDLLNDLKHISFDTAKYHAHKYGRDASSEEFSVALNGLNIAIDAFDLNRDTKFETFARRIITLKLIDFFRSNKKSTEFVAVDSEKITFISDRKSYSDYKNDENAQNSNEQMKNDLIKFNSIIAKQGYSWVDIQQNRPKRKDALEALRNIAIHIARMGLAVAFLEENPCSVKLKKMIGADISRRTLTKYRPYLCAILITLTHDLPAMRNYLDFFNRKEVNEGG